MIVNFKKENLEIEKTTDVLDDIEMTFDKDAMAIQFQMFINNIYSNPIGSIVREITSNAVDSHIEAGIKEPVVISLQQENGEYSISFIDYGIGMSPERVKIYSSFLSSTKRENNNEIGGWGVGGKSILAYKRYNGIGGEYDNSYNIITRYDGIEYGYYIYEGQDRPIVTQLYKTQTNEGNGTQIKIPVDSSDISVFINEIRRQLFYFDNVLYNGFDDFTAYNLNDYNIVEGKNFIYRGHTYDNYIHVCLGNVAYPIDYKTIGLSRYDNELPVAIKLPVGSIGVTVSRESLDYSQDAVKLIKEKLDKVKKEITELYNDNNKTIKTLKQYLDHNKSTNKIIKFDNGLSLNVSNIVNEEDIIEYENFKYKDFIKKNVRSNKIFSLITNTHNLADKRKKHSSTTIDNVFEDAVYLINTSHETPSDRKINRFLKFKHNGSFKVVKKLSYDVVKDSFLLDDIFYKDNITETKFNEIQNDLFEYYLKPTIPNYFDVVYPEEFFKRTKKAKNKQLINIGVLIGHSLNRCKAKFNLLDNFKGSIYYGTKEETDELMKALRITASLFRDVKIIGGTNNTHDKFTTTYDYNHRNTSIPKSRIGFFVLSKANAEKVKKLSNFHHISKFETKMVRRKMSVINLLYEKTLLENKKELLSIDFKNTINKSTFDLINPKTKQKFDKLEEKVDDLITELKKHNVRDSLLRTNQSSNIIDLLKEQCSHDNISKDVKNILNDFDKVIKYNEQIEDYLNVMYGYTDSDHYWLIIEMINDKIKKENN